MRFQASDLKELSVCPTDDIAAYIDGEVDLARELELELHFDTCRICSDELNEQKQFLCHLDASLKNESEMELPLDFTRSIVANAEANVSGLRKPAEIYNSLFVCAAITVFILFAAGAANSGEMLSEGYAMFAGATVVGGVFAHLVYDVFLGIAVILRSFAAQFRVDVVMAVLLSILLAAPTIILSRRMLRVGRA
jgi:anti-sigma factor RsiW